MEEKMHNFSDDHVKLIRETVGKDAANEAEFQRFLHRASKLNLDPLDGSIHLTSRNKKVYDPDKKADRWEKVNTIIVGIDGFRAVADINKKLSGIARGLLRDDKGLLIGGWAEVFRPDWEKPARNEVLLKEYQQIKDGRPTGMWANMPAAMIMKCAEAGAHRMANPALFARIYTPEEMEQAESEPIKEPVPTVKYEDPPKADPPKVGATVEPPKAETPKVDDPKAPTETPKADPPKEAPAEPPKADQPTDSPKTPAETSGDETIEHFNGQVIAMEDVRKVKSYMEVWVFDPFKNIQYQLRGKKIPEDLKEKDLVAVVGARKGDVIKPESVLRMGSPVVTSAATPVEPPAPAETPVTPAATPAGSAFTVTLTTEPKSGTKDFGAGTEKVVWSRATLDGKEMYLVARGDNMPILQGVKNGSVVAVKGTIESDYLIIASMEIAA